MFAFLKAECMFAFLKAHLPEWLGHVLRLRDRTLFDVHELFTMGLCVGLDRPIQQRGRWCSWCNNEEPFV